MSDLTARVEAVRTLAERATPGPWEASQYYGDEGPWEDAPGRTHAEVLALLDRAIAAAPEDVS